MKSKNLLLSIVLLCCTLFHNCTHKKSSITEVEALRKIDTTEGRISRFDLFIVRDYENSEDAKLIIDAFVADRKKDSPEKYYQYDMTFYKESSMTTPSKLINNPKILFRYSQDHDLLYNFSWQNGKMVSKMKFENGHAVD